MGIKIVPYEAGHEPAVAEFNARLAAAKIEFRFFSRCSSSWLPADTDAPVHRLYRLAVEEDGTVRGGFALRCQQFTVGGERHRVANYQLPLSEGIFDPQYRTLGTRLLRSALREFPLMYALGMGGLEQPLPRLLGACGFDLSLVPFYFRVLNGRRFCSEMRVLRSSPLRRMLAGLVAGSGVASLACRTYHWATTRCRPDNDFEVIEVPELGDWITPLWEATESELVCGAIRSSAVMQRVLASHGGRNRRLQISNKGQPIGYAVVRCTPMDQDRYFGSLRLGSVVDAWSRPEHAAQIVRLSTEYLRSAGADLIISNQCHRAWTRALTDNGYVSFRSNFGLAVSPKLVQRFGGSLTERLGECHFNRSDGDGPIHI